MRTWLIVLLLAVPALTGCLGQDPAGDELPRTLTVTSTAFEDGGSIPEPYTCDGSHTSPQLDVGSLPDGTETVVLVVDDPDAPSVTFIHWLVWNVPTSGGIAHVPEGSVPDGAVEGQSSTGETGYTGPCPPRGDGAHTYRFKAYALGTTLALEPGARHSELTQAAEGHLLAWGQLTGTYRR